MAARFWVTGGTGNWNSTTNWSATTGGASGASVPGSADTAAFDASSGSGTATLDISPDIQTLTCTGFTGTLAFGTNTISLNSTGTIFTGATTMTVTGTPQIICTNNSATARTISPQIVTEANSISFRVTAGTGTVTITSTQAVRDLDFTDGVNPTGYAGALNNSAITIYGNFTASTGMTRTAGATTYTFAATSGTKTINTAGVTFDNAFTFSGVGGAFQLVSALTSGATRTCTLTNGTLDLNGQTLTIGTFSSSNSNARTLAFGTGKMVLTFNATGTVFTTSTATNLTLSGTRRVEITGVGTAGNTRTISGGLLSTGGGAESNAMDFYISAGADIINFGTAPRAFRTIDFTGFSGSTLTNSAPYIYTDLTLSSTMTVTSGTNSWTFASGGQLANIFSNGTVLNVPITVIGDPYGGVWFRDAVSIDGNQLTFSSGTVRFSAGTTNTVGAFVTTGTTQKYLDSDNPGVQATLSDASGTNSVSYLSIQDSNAIGGAYWDATANTNTNLGNNTGWDFSDVAIQGAGNIIGFGFGFRI